MTEDQYIIVTNHERLRLAEGLLREVVPDDKHKPRWKEIISYISGWTRELHEQIEHEGREEGREG